MDNEDIGIIIKIMKQKGSSGHIQYVGYRLHDYLVESICVHFWCDDESLLNIYDNTMIH